VLLKLKSLVLPASSMTIDSVTRQSAVLTTNVSVCVPSDACLGVSSSTTLPARLNRDDGFSATLNCVLRFAGSKNARAVANAVAGAGFLMSCLCS